MLFETWDYVGWLPINDAMVCRIWFKIGSWLTRDILDNSKILTTFANGIMGLPHFAFFLTVGLFKMLWVNCHKIFGTGYNPLNYVDLIWVLEITCCKFAILHSILYYRTTRGRWKCWTWKWVTDVKMQDMKMQDMKLQEWNSRTQKITQATNV